MGTERSRKITFNKDGTFAFVASDDTSNGHVDDSWPEWFDTRTDTGTYVQIAQHHFKVTILSVKVTQKS